MNTQGGTGFVNWRKILIICIFSFVSKGGQDDHIQRKVINGSWIQKNDGIISDVYQLDLDTEHPTMVGHIMIISDRG
jgi:hypothetical protein